MPWSIFNGFNVNDWRVDFKAAVKCQRDGGNISCLLLHDHHDEPAHTLLAECGSVWEYVKVLNNLANQGNLQIFQ